MLVSNPGHYAILWFYQIANFLNFPSFVCPHLHHKKIFVPLHFFQNSLCHPYQ